MIFSSRSQQFGLVEPSWKALCDGILRAGIFIFLASASIGSSIAAPCSGVDRKLTEERKTVMAPKIARELKVASVDVLQSLRSNGWSIIYVDIHVSDEAFLFYSGDPMTTRHVSAWSGAAGPNELADIENWVVKNSPRIPRMLAKCFAWHVTHGRGK